MLKLFFLVLIFAKIDCLAVNKPVLYFPNDTNVVIANVSTYQNILFNQDKVTIFQFFNSWCGHCVRFAPIWKAFAKNISNWDSVVNVVALDCVDQKNIEVCRNYSIYSYPSIRLFWHNVNSTDDFGESLTDIKPEVEFIKDELVNFIVQKSNLTYPSTWPKINKFEIKNKQDLNDLFKQENNENTVNLAIIESNLTFYGQKVILEFSKFKDKVKITSLSAINLNDFGLDFDSSKETALIKINSDNSLELLMKLPLQETTSNIYVNYLNEKYFNFALRLNENINNIGINKQTENRNNKQPVDVPMYINDLYGSIKYTLYQQIPLKKTFNGTQLNILKRFFDIVENYFPDQDTEFINFIKGLNKFLQTQEQELKIDDYLKFLENNKYNFDSKYDDWITCKGSSPNYRGYTCSLWSLFHSLTVNEYLKEKNTQKWVNLHEVLFTMRDYIGNFFSCTDCAQHFLGMSSNLENELKYPNSSVIWLWNAHNTVNKRLAGTETEDPEHVKSIYPYQKSCPQCYSKKDFNEKEVFNYLIDRYGKVELNKPKSDRISSKLISESKLSFDDSNKFNHTDYSICFALYFLTTLILMTVFFFYLPLRFKRRAKFIKSKFLEA